MIFMLIFGLGLGNCMQPLMLAVQNAVAARDIGVATSSATFFRQIGGTLGVAVFLSMLFSSLPKNIAAAFGAAKSTPDFLAAAQPTRRTPSSPSSSSPVPWAAPARR